MDKQQAEDLERTNELKLKKEDIISIADYARLVAKEALKVEPPETQNNEDLMTLSDSSKLSGLVLFSSSPYWISMR